MKPSEPRVISSRLLYGSFAPVRIERLLLPNNEEYDHETVQLGNGVVVLPFLDERTLLLVNVYRHSVRKWVLEPPGGGINPGDRPADAARRELLEETGYAARSLQPLASYWPIPGIVQHRLHVFSARKLQYERRPKLHCELIQVVTLPYDEVSAGSLSGRYPSGPLALALYAESAHRGRQRTARCS